VSQRGHDGVDAVAANLQARHAKPIFIGLGNCGGWARESLKLACREPEPEVFPLAGFPCEQMTVAACG